MTPTSPPPLKRSERILWQGRPYRGFFYSPQQTGIAAIAAFFITFAYLWKSAAASMAAGIEDANGALFEYVGLFFIAFGLWLIIGAPLFEHINRFRTDYTLTSEAAIIRSGIFRRKTERIVLVPGTAIKFTDFHKDRRTIEITPRVYNAEKAKFNPTAFKLILNPDAVMAQFRTVIGDGE